MVTVIVLVGLWVGFFAGFRWLGGLGAAGDAFRRWGKASSSIRVNPGSSS
ncbi:MAG TPA: hypothetical protein VF101_15380 [Gaiellaceae bacterium]